MALAGTGMLIKASTTAGGAGTYTTIAEIKSGSMNTAAGSIDVSAFGSTWADALQGLKSVQYSLQGFWKSDDTTGQVAIRSALVNDSEIWFQFLPDGSTGFKQQVAISSFNISAAVDGAVEVSIEAAGVGAPAAV